MAATVPTEPIIVPRPRPSTGSAQFYWQPPGSDGGSPIIRYTLACAAIAFTQDISATESTYTATGLPNKVDLTFTLTATNAVGTGPAATFRTIQAGTTPFGPATATLSTINVSTALITWSPSTVATEALVKWYRIYGVPSSLTMSSFSLTQKNYRFASIAGPLSTNTYYQFLVQGINDVGYCSPFAYTSTVGFGIQVDPFSPSTLTQQLGIWLDATNQASFGLTGSTVTLFRSLTAPSVSTNTIGGFTATPNYIGSTTVLTTSPQATGGFATFPFTPSPYTSSALTGLWVGALNDLPQQSRILSVDIPQPANEGRSGVLIGAPGGGATSLFVSRNDPNTLAASTTIAGFSTLSLVTMSIAPYLQYIAVNGSNASMSRGIFSTFNVAQLGIGRNDSTTFFAGAQAELLVYYDELTLYDRQRVEGQLANKWGLQGSLPPQHPFKWDPPNKNTTTAAFFPTRLNGLVTWLDAADPLGTGSAPPTGTPLTTWFDKSFSGRSGQAAGVTPIYRSESPYGYIDMSGAGYYTIGTNPAVTSNYFTMFVVERVQGGTYGVLTGGTGATTNTNNVISYIPANLSGLSWNYINNVLNVLTGISSFTTAAAQPTRLWSFSFTTSNRSVYQNGFLLGSNTANARLSSWSNATIGYTSNTNLYYTGQYKEFIMYLGELTSSSRQRVEGYLAWKWGLQSNLASNHPWRNSQPTV